MKIYEFSIPVILKVEIATNDDPSAACDMAYRSAESLEFTSLVGMEFGESAAVVGVLFDGGIRMAGGPPREEEDE